MGLQHLVIIGQNILPTAVLYYHTPRYIGRRATSTSYRCTVLSYTPVYWKESNSNKLLFYCTIIRPSILEGEQLQQATAVLYYHTPQYIGRRATPTSYRCKKKDKKRATLFGCFLGLFMYWMIRYWGEQVLKLLLYSYDTLVLSSWY